MKYLKTCNEIYYIDFDNKDYKKFVAEHRNNRRKVDIRIIPNNLDGYHFLEGLIPLIQYIKLRNLKGIVRVLIFTGGSVHSKEYIRVLLEGYEKYYKLIGGDLSFVYKDRYIRIFKSDYTLTINSHDHYYMGYGHNNIIMHLYEDGFYSHGTNISMLKDSIDHDKVNEVYVFNPSIPRQPIDKSDPHVIYNSIHKRKMEKLKLTKSYDKTGLTIQ